jgi:hypothetical protein
MRKMMMIALSALAFGAAVPAIAQDAMASHDQMASGSMKAGKKMSAADTKKMDACSAMSHDAMMKDSKCAKMMKARPDTMKSDAMSKPGN